MCLCARTLLSDSCAKRSEKKQLCMHKVEMRFSMLEICWNDAKIIAEKQKHNKTKQRKTTKKHSERANKAIKVFRLSVFICMPVWVSVADEEFGDPEANVESFFQFYSCGLKKGPQRLRPIWASQRAGALRQSPQIHYDNPPLVYMCMRVCWVFWSMIMRLSTKSSYHKLHTAYLPFVVYFFFFFSYHLSKQDNNNTTSGPNVERCTDEDRRLI